MYNFSYKRPLSLQEAVDILSNNDDAQALAGGQTLLPTLKHRLARPETLLDLQGIEELQGISVEQDTIRIAAMTRHAQVANSAEIQNTLPALSHLAGGIGDPLVRNMGTMGGSLANSDPAADYPAAVLGVAATIHTDRRDIAADDFFLGMFETALEPGELIVSVSYPLPLRAAYIKFPNPASGYVVVGVFIAEFSSGVRVAINGAGPCVFREQNVEAALNTSFSVDAVNEITISHEGFNNDIHATSEYRAHLAKVLIKRVIQKITNN